MIREDHILGTYRLLCQQKKHITWKDVLTSVQEDNLCLPDEYDANMYNAAKELSFALERLDCKVSK